jgi:hypothetical protein
VGMRAQAAWAQCNSRSHSQQCRAMDKSCRRMGLAVGRRAQAAWAWVQQQKPCTAVQGNGRTILHMHSGLCSASVEYRCAGVASMRCACTAFCVQCHAAYCFPGLVSIRPVCARRHHFHEDYVEVPRLVEWPCRRREHVSANHSAHQAQSEPVRHRSGTHTCVEQQHGTHSQQHGTIFGYHWQRQNHEHIRCTQTQTACTMLPEHQAAEIAGSKTSWQQQVPEQ